MKQTPEGDPIELRGTSRALTLNGHPVMSGDLIDSSDGNEFQVTGAGSDDRHVYGHWAEGHTLEPRPALVTYFTGLAYTD